MLLETFLVLNRNIPENHVNIIAVGAFMMTSAMETFSASPFVRVIPRSPMNSPHQGLLEQTVE